MGIENIHSLGDLNALFHQNKNRLGEEEQRLFQGILLELGKSGGPDPMVLGELVKRLGELRNLYNK